MIQHWKFIQPTLHGAPSGVRDPKTAFTRQEWIWPFCFSLFPLFLFVFPLIAMGCFVDGIRSFSFSPTSSIAMQCQGVLCHTRSGLSFPCTFEVVVMLQLSPEQRHSHPLTHCTAEEFRLPDRLQREGSPQTMCNLWFH